MDHSSEWLIGVLIRIGKTLDMAVNKKLVLLNTCVSYLRTALNVFVSLFTTRWVVQTLGVEDFGLYSVVGGVVSFAAILNGALSAGSYRFMAYALGQDERDVTKWFSASFYLHFACALVILMISVPLYFFAFRVLFAIPDLRIEACQVVYWCSILVTCSLVLNAPFVAMFTAYQRIFEVTLINLMNTFLMFAFAFSLRYVSFDKLAYYALGCTSIHVLVYLIQIVRTFYAFKAARILSVSKVERSRYVKLLSFSWWSLLDSIAFLTRNYGIQLIFNRRASVGTNAAYSVANQLSSQSLVLSGAMTAAMSPGIISQYGSGDVKGACEWALRVCRFATILAMLVVVPLFLECRFVFDVWLVSYPPIAIDFALVMIGMYVITQLVTGLNTLIRAKGQIARYQIMTAVSYISGVMLALVVVTLGLRAEFAIYGVATSTVFYAIATLAECQRLALASIKSWLQSVFVPGVLVLLTAFFCTKIFMMLLRPSWWRMSLVILFGDLLVLSLSWMLYFSQDERQYVLWRIRKLIG